MKISRVLFIKNNEYCGIPSGEDIRMLINFSYRMRHLTVGLFPWQTLIDQS